MTATETDALISLISRCAQSCEGCGGHVSGVMPDRRLLIYCKDAAQKCSDLAEAMRTDASHASEKLAECYHSVERAASMLELQIFDFCRECAKLCRETAQACKLLAQDRNIVLT